MDRFKGVIFDLDGVLVDTAKYHYSSWSEIAKQLNIIFTEKDNERLKGVSREDSLDILLSLGNQFMSESEKKDMADKKNNIYVNYINTMNSSEILPGILDTLNFLKKSNIMIALGSASKNARTILENTNLINFFDVIVDGNDVQNTKPDPEVFLLSIKKLGVNPEDCIVIEDSEAGCQAAQTAGTFAIGVGKKCNLPSASITVSSTLGIKETLKHQFSKG